MQKKCLKKYITKRDYNEFPWLEALISENVLLRQSNVRQFVRISEEIELCTENLQTVTD